LTKVEKQYEHVYNKTPCKHRLYYLQYNDNTAQLCKTHKDKNLSSYTEMLPQCVAKHKSTTQVLILSSYKLF